MSKLRSGLTYANVIATFALFLALGGGALAATGLIGSDGKIRGCVGKTGQLTVQKPGKKCSKGDRALSWNQTGPRGLQGLSGTPGQPGAPGQPGKDGKDGTPADVQGEAVHPVGPATSSCDTNPGNFCRTAGVPGFFNAGGGGAPTGYQKDAAGYVHLRGSIGADFSGAGGGPTAVFYLPVGYRPTDGSRHFLVPASSGCGGFKEILVDPDGAVRTVDGSGCLTALDGVDFHP